ncbi:MAG: hypothetical protein J5833_05155 [Victivallales bacterium]|nr:hypothetical protein [Victivallales bacterium]
MAIRIMNEQFEWRIAEDGKNLGFYDVRKGENHLLTAADSSCACIRKGDWRVDATAVEFSDGVLSYTFGDAGSAKIAVETHAGYCVFTVQSVEGDFDQLDFINIPTSLKAEPDVPFGACTIALSLKSNVEELPGPQEHLWTAAYRRFGFIGAQTGLVASPFTQMREIMKEMVGKAPGVPHSPLCGPWGMDSPLPAVSNVMEAPRLDNADEWIDFCKQMGIGAIEFNGTLDYGSYEPAPSVFPNGYPDVRKLVDKLHANGILAGLHTMSFSISKRCPWVTPVPDPRLAKERDYTLAKDIGYTDDTIVLADDTCDLPPTIDYYIRRSMTLQIGDELIEFKKVSEGRPFTVSGCVRGACGTKAAAHKAGDVIHHLKECWGCFAPDGESTLFAEVADKISNAVNKCNFDFVYLDGLDGSHIIGGEDARWHYGAKFTFEVFRGLDHPIMMEMATFHHHLWYVRTRMQAWDHGRRNHKMFNYLHTYSNNYARRMFMPLHMGWIGVFPWVSQQTDQTFWDDIEYIWGKSLATDANFTLQCVTPSSLKEGAWLSDLAPAIRSYESLRQSHHFGADVKKRLLGRDDEARLVPMGDGKWNFQPIQAVCHQVDDLDGLSDGWSFQSKFRSQRLAVRIQALYSVAAYDSDDAVTLIDDFSKFRDPGDTITILNSGKLYVYPSSAPGMKSAMAVGGADGPVKKCGEWTASRDCSNGLILSSAPDDRYSLYDHFEREYNLREASWTHLHADFGKDLDLSNAQGLGFWLKGDGKGEVLDIVLRGHSHGICCADHYIKVDFTGWRYFEFQNSSSVEFEQCSWPFNRCHYGVYRAQFNFAKVQGLDIWVNNVAKGGGVSLKLGPVKALPLVPQHIVRPMVFVNGAAITFPVSLRAGQYLEYYGEGKARVFEGNGNLLGEVEPVGTVPVVCEGRNSVGFRCERDALRPHARVTVMTLSDRMFGDLPDAAAPSWGRGCIAAPEYGTRSFAAADSSESAVDFIAP